MNIYIVHIHTEKGFHYTMPYYFTSEKEAYLYGEYTFRETEIVRSYDVEKLVKIYSFYKLK